MHKKWPDRVYPAAGGDWYAPMPSKLAVKLFPMDHTLRATLMILQIGQTQKGRNFSIVKNACNCWEVNKVQVGRAKVKLINAGLLEELPANNNGSKRVYRLTKAALGYLSSSKKLKCEND